VAEPVDLTGFETIAEPLGVQLDKIVSVAQDLVPQIGAVAAARRIAADCSVGTVRALSVFLGLAAVRLAEQENDRG
jgi:hypothetical protein